MDEPVKLSPSIDRGHTWSEAWRAECEARMVASLPRSQRLDYYEHIAKRRGEDAARALSAAVRDVYRQSPPPG
jgi:hypothetical protein